MPENTWVRIAIVIVLVLVLYYLVIALTRGVARGAEVPIPHAAAGRFEAASSPR